LWKEENGSEERDFLEGSGDNKNNIKIIGSPPFSKLNNGVDNI
jgi:hypothetical protein